MEASRKRNAPSAKNVNWSTWGSSTQLWKLTIFPMRSRVTTISTPNSLILISDSNKSSKTFQYFGLVAKPSRKNNDKNHGFRLWKLSRETSLCSITTLSSRGWSRLSIRSTVLKRSTLTISTNLIIRLRDHGVKSQARSKLSFKIWLS